MGSTYSVAKAVDAIRANDGLTYYTLIETTVESNVYPRSPRTGAIFFGVFEDCMSRIIMHAGSCEGGMLRGASGCIRPESYIRQWRAALAAPVFCDEDSVAVRFGSSIYSVPEEKRAAFREAFARHGLVFDESSDETHLDLRCCAGAIAELVRDDDVYPWRLRRTGSSRASGDSESSAPSQGNASEVPSIEVQVVKLPANPEAAFDEDEYILVNANGEARGTGWHFATMNSFIRDEVVVAERSHPGCAEALIRNFRSVVNDAPSAHPDTILRITRASADSSDAGTAFRQGRFDELLEKLRQDGSPGVFRDNSATGSFDTSVGDIARVDGKKVLHSLDGGLQILALRLAGEGKPTPETQRALA